MILHVPIILIATSNILNGTQEFSRIEEEKRSFEMHCEFKIQAVTCLFYGQPFIIKHVKIHSCYTFIGCGHKGFHHRF